MKRVKSGSDLAINGAPPMFDFPIHVGRPNLGDRAVFDRYVDGIFERNWLSNDGPLLQEFERSLARRLQVDHCVAMCNGTIALEIAIRALDLRGEVIVPSYTFVATAHALQWQEITPVFADIDPRTHSLDPIAVRRMITPRTSGILAVHLWGKPAAVDELTAVAREYRLRLMFDASHAFGCSLNGVPIGSFGECEVFSFHATKVFNTFEGGAVVTNNRELAAKMRLMRNFGFAGYDDVIYPGTNGKMTEIAAAMGLTNLCDLERFIAANRRNYSAYEDGLRDIPGLSLLPHDAAQSCNFQYIVVELDRSFPISRDRAIEALHAENILARRYFWPGCHRMEPYRSFYPHAGLMLPNTQAVADRVVVLPTGGSIDQSGVGAICSILRVLSQSAGHPSSVQQ